LTRWIAPLVESADRHPIAGDRDAIESFYAEFDNVREAILWAVANDRVLALRFLTRAHEVLRDAGMGRTVFRWLETVYRRDDPPDVRRRALKALLLEARHDDLVAARQYGEELLDAAQKEGDPAAIAALTGLGIVALREPDNDTARALFTEAIVLARRAGDGGREAYALCHLRHKENDLLAATQCRQTYLDDMTQRSDQTVALRCSDDDEGRLRVEYAPAL
jgi:hypothetical protein